MPDQPKMERLFTVPGTRDAIRLTCEIESDGTDVSSVSVSCNTAGRVTTARLIATADEKLFVLVRAACVNGTAAGDRVAVATLVSYLEAWYQEYAGAMLLRSLYAFANPPPGAKP